ncbi:MAG TPA: MJ0042-type zinc finger domain-containing protein [Kofleriaceae bacterium]
MASRLASIGHRARWSHVRGGRALGEAPARRHRSARFVDDRTGGSIEVGSGGLAFACFVSRERDEVVAGNKTQHASDAGYLRPALMVRKRVSRRADERAARKIVRDREKLAALSRGGSSDHPIEVPSSAVVETRVRNSPCPQCEGTYRIVEHTSPSSGLRRVDVRCQLCGTPRALWFRLVSDEPS